MLSSFLTSCPQIFIILLVILTPKFTSYMCLDLRTYESLKKKLDFEKHFKFRELNETF